jgi:hypothetical protein
MVAEEAPLLLMYVRPEIGLRCIDEAPGRGVETVVLNPGTESPELLRRIAELGMRAVQDCAIVRVGKSPADFPE